VRRRKTPHEERLQKLNGLTDEEIKEIRKASYELAELSESGLQYISEDLYETEIERILKNRGITGNESSGKAQRDRINFFATSTSRSFLRKELKRQSRSEACPEILMLDDDGELVPIEGVNCFERQGRGKSDHMFMPWPLSHHSLDEDKDRGENQ
jgi:hypothetical protein